MPRNEVSAFGVLKSLRVVSLPGSDPSPEQLRDYNSAYATWRTVWLETFRELEGAERLYSDEFCRQNEILCIFRERECLAMGLMRWTNLELQSARDDSQLGAWPVDALENVASHGSRIIIASRLTLHPLARGGALGLPMMDVIIGLMIRRMLESGAHAMLGAPRTDRGVHRACYRLGGTPLVPGVIRHNAPIDLIAFFPQKVTEGEEPVAGAVRYLWDFKRHTDQNSELHKGARHA
ncbi:hypothetical protein [Methylosinus sporium]|uniref:hypothetical protein n=1 Tax=Methylosinus sporium TaxID=428 RepID=UPI000D59C84C|nr:hypothetical protein [Methylosinus sporium]